eukprot:SAG31_NODE_547_length_14228_cov_3.787105_12_plen_203_part_00
MAKHRTHPYCGQCQRLSLFFTDSFHIVDRDGWHQKKGNQIEQVLSICVIQPCQIVPCAARVIYDATSRFGTDTDPAGLVDGRLVVVASTPTIRLIDPALIRAGRLETHIYIGQPDSACRRALIFSMFATCRHQGHSHGLAADEKWLDHLVTRTEGWSRADLAALHRDSVLMALRDDVSASHVCRVHVDRVLSMMRVRQGHKD